MVQFVTYHSLDRISTCIDDHKASGFDLKIHNFRFGVHLKREYNFVFTKPVIMPIKSEQLRKIDKQQKELERAVTAQKY